MSDETITRVHGVKVTPHDCTSYGDAGKLRYDEPHFTPEQLREIADAIEDHYDDTLWSDEEGYFSYELSESDGVITSVDEAGDERALDADAFATVLEVLESGMSDEVSISDVYGHVREFDSCEDDIRVRVDGETVFLIDLPEVPELLDRLGR